MFSSFKNTELFRYFIRVDLNRGIDKILRQNNSNYSLIAGSIFSGSFSILGTYYSINQSRYSLFINLLISTFTFIILFIIGILIYQLMSKIWHIIRNHFCSEKGPSKSEIKEYIDNFDHIACDNILISQSFIEAYKEDPKLTYNMKEFYFYEIMYYTKVSMGIINSLFVYSHLCINDKNNTNRVHLYRIINILNMIKEIVDFLSENSEQIQLEDNMKSSLCKEIDDLKETLRKLQDISKEIHGQKYS